MDKRTNTLKEKLKDERSNKVIFVSHCILNENVRYFGGAFRKNGVNEIIDGLQKQGIGIVQMKCPEQKAWGGVLKRYALFAYGLKGSMPLIYKFRKLLISFFIWNTKRMYRKLANETASEIEDYKDSGFEVIGILGIDGSPSCGIKKMLDFEKSFEYVAFVDTEDLERNRMNKYLYESCLSSGRGLFTAALKDELEKRNMETKFYSHSLISEMSGKKTKINFR